MLLKSLMLYSPSSASGAAVASAVSAGVLALGAVVDSAASLLFFEPQAARTNNITNINETSSAFERIGFLI
ncbi:hypothetical protein D3C76_879660 [compost metagenome]